MSIYSFSQRNTDLKKNKENINYAYWWNGKRYFLDIVNWIRGAQNNWGDLINPILISYISGKRTIYANKLLLNSPSETVYFVCGSTLRMCTENSIIWGSGFLSEKERITKKPRKICAVRGPLTRDILLKQNCECPEIYGDPAMFYPKFFRPETEKEYKFGFVLGNVVKYILRHEHKHHKEDLIKAIWYLVYEVTTDLALADSVADDITKHTGEANERLH